VVAAVPMAIASGALRVEIEAILAAEALIRISAPLSVPMIRGGQAVAASYLLALERLAAAVGRSVAFDPGCCVAIEDSRWGIEAAKAAGMRVSA